jgi:hypothetical protein
VFCQQSWGRFAALELGSGDHRQPAQRWPPRGPHVSHERVVAIVDQHRDDDLVNGLERKALVQHPASILTPQRHAEERAEQAHVERSGR